jgi:hypothetical protein
MAQDVTVTITRRANNPAQCIVEPNPFRTSPGDTVTFKFEFDAPDGQVIFLGPSPFDNEPGMKPGEFTQKRAHKVRDVGQGGGPKKFDFKVKWSGGAGSGDGQGEVIPG